MAQYRDGTEVNVGDRIEWSIDRTFRKGGDSFVYDTGVVRGILNEDRINVFFDGSNREQFTAPVRCRRLRGTSSIQPVSDLSSVSLEDLVDELARRVKGK